MLKKLISRIRNNKAGIYTALLCTTGLNILMLLVRMRYSGWWAFFFLPWNLFLAWVPLFFAMAFEKAEKKKMHFIPLSLLFAGWLFFFPNAPYIITDLVHLKAEEDVPIWFDISLIISYAWCGLALGLISLYKVHQSLLCRMKPWLARPLLGTCLAAASFGIYLGRVLRWNTWDIILHPIQLAKVSIHTISHPATHTDAYGMTIFFTLFLTTCYGFMQGFLQMSSQYNTNKNNENNA